MKVLSVLISVLILYSCSTKDVIFKNEQFKAELDSFISENKESKENILHLEIADESDIFEDVADKNNEDVYLTFYYSAPEDCIGFYKSFNYRGKLILLYEVSEKIKFSDLLDITKESKKCNEDLLLDGYMDIPPMRSYYFNDKNRLIEIKHDGSQRIVE